MHDRAEIVRNAMRGYDTGSMFAELIRITNFNIFNQNSHVLITIISWLFMEKSERMT